MIQIEGIDVLDGDKPTEAGVDLMRMVYEAMDMGCWHEFVYSSQLDDSYCTKCGVHYESFWTEENEGDEPDLQVYPSYLTSLDDLRPIWDKLFPNIHFSEWPEYFGSMLLQAELHHHVEALARTLTVECDKCDDGAQCGQIDKPDKPCIRDGLPCKPCAVSIKCSSCKGTGKRTILDVWCEKWRDNGKAS